MSALEKLRKNGIILKYEDIADLCQKYQVKELYLFGSAIREDFNEESDVDILISYKPEAKVSLFEEVDLCNEISELIQRDVDIVDIEGLRNPIRREEILSTREIVYAFT